MNELERESHGRRGAAIVIVLIASVGIGWLLMAPSSSHRGLSPAAFAMVPATVGQNANTIIFNRDIRPILADRCFSCHGPDPNKRQAKLRLDRPASALGPLPGHPQQHAFVPGDPAHSEALARILSPDPGLIMPPPASHRELSASEKELIRQWVIQGGPYQEHWAFTAPTKPPVPTVQNAAWPKNDIDRFVLANLEANGLQPSPQADRATLIRRVSLDLTGIPPSLDEVNAFVADASPDAYEKVVDRLLASPHYGEQMATQWLDYARYADSHGFQADPERHMWKWRDWVINAYNSNMPFDQFAIKQLAGDLLPDATIDDRIATGFNRNHRINEEGGIIPEEWRVEGVIDRVSTTSAVFLGLTLECCRCHDHKYDPITQKEFYSFSGYFNSVEESGVGDTAATDKGINVPPILKLPTPEQERQFNTVAARITALSTKLEGLKKSIPDHLTKLGQTGARMPEPDGLVARLPLNGDINGTSANGNSIDTKYVGKTPPSFVDSPLGKAIEFKEKGSAVNLGDAFRFERTDKFSYGAWVKPRGDGAVMSRMNANEGFTGFDLFVEREKVVAHVIHRYPDIAIKVETNAKLPKNKWTHVFVTYDGSSQAAGLKIYFDGMVKPLKILNDGLNDSILTDSPVLIGGRDGGSSFDGSVADARFYNRLLAPPEVAEIALGVAARNVLQVPAHQRTAQQTAALSNYVEKTDPDIAGTATELSAATEQKDKLYKEIPDTMVMQELPKPRETFVLMRGEYDKHGDKVEPGVPAVLPPLPKDAPPNRLTLARWIVDPSNPLTARVQANRFWEKFFGVGIVKTSENFGTQTEWPSNPQLLDYLGTEMVALHWDMKALQKEIVMSAAYQQASAVTPEMQDRDPENRLIARGPRFRLSAEEVRDQALAVSGLLVEKLGGPSARPYEPADLWAGNSFGNLAKYLPDSGEGLYRRSIYTFIKRSAVPANLSLFDQPSREYCVIRRSRTDTPLQALDLMNDPTYVEASRVLAQRLMANQQTPAERIAAAFKRVTARAPTQAELDVLTSGFERELAKFSKDPDAAAKLISVGEAPHDPKLPAPELAAYTVTSGIILNLDETVTRQ